MCSTTIPHVKLYDMIDQVALQATWSIILSIRERNERSFCERQTEVRLPGHPNHAPSIWHLYDNYDILMSMDAEISQNKLNKFYLIIRDLNTAMKNSNLYNADHPVYLDSLKTLIKSLSEWFNMEDKIEIGIAQEAFLLDGVYIKRKSDMYRRMATYMHKRGVTLISISKGIGIDELSIFVRFIKNDAKTIKAKGGIAKNIPKTRYLTVKEIDYSVLLKNVGGKVTEEEDKIWKSVCGMADASKKGMLSQLTPDRLKEFVKDPNKTAAALNKIYREGVANLDETVAVDNVRIVLKKISESAKDNELGISSAKIKEDVASIVLKLNPEFILKLFDLSDQDGSMDFAKELVSGSSNNDITDFIESLISSKDDLSENLISIFDTLTPGKEKAGNVASMVLEKLMEENLVSGHAMTDLRSFIESTANAHPESYFMSRMFRQMNEAFMKTDRGLAVDMEGIGRLVREDLELITGEKLIHTKIRLLMNLVYIDRTINDVEDIGCKIVGMLKGMDNVENVYLIREVVDFFNKVMKTECAGDRVICGRIDAILDDLKTEDMAKEIISCVHDAEGKDLDNIVFMLASLRDKCVGNILDLYVLEQDAAFKYKLGLILSKMKGEASDECLKRIIEEESYMAGDLFKIMIKFKSDKVNTAARKLISNPENPVRLDAIRNFKPVTDEEISLVCGLLQSEKDQVIQVEAVRVLVKTGRKDVIDKLFMIKKRGRSRKKFLLKVIEMCGTYRINDSFGHLKEIFLKKPLFPSDANDELRVAVCVSLGRIKTKESMELIRLGCEDKRPPVRKMCGIIIKLDENGPKGQENKN